LSNESTVFFTQKSLIKVKLAKTISTQFDDHEYLCVSFLKSGICILIHSLTTLCTIEKTPIRLKRKHFLNKPFSNFPRFFFPIANLKFVEIHWNFYDKVWQIYFNIDLESLPKFEARVGTHYPFTHPPTGFYWVGG
jgi:hypothetical protein